MTAESSALRLIVGLGNPGPQYVDTRHNAGFWWVDELARRHGGQLRMEAKFNAETCRIPVAGHDVWLLKPMTYMNHSGQSLIRFLGFYKILPNAILVAHDELDLPPGVVRVKRGGGHGGHKGLRDVMRHLGGGDFLRLRLGIGHPGDSRDVVGYVLRRAPREEQQRLDEALQEAASAFPWLVEGRLQKAMHVLHSRRVNVDSANP